MKLGTFITQFLPIHRTRCIIDRPVMQRTNGRAGAVQSIHLLLLLQHHLSRGRHITIIIILIYNGSHGNGLWEAANSSNGS